MLSPNRRIAVTPASLDCKMVQLILLILFRRVNLSFVYVGQWSRLEAALKAVLKLRSRRWLKPKRNLVNSLIPLGL